MPAKSPCTRLIGLTACTALVISMAGCAIFGPPPGAEELAAALASGLESGDPEAVSFTDQAAALADYTIVTENIAGLHPQVEVGEIEYGKGNQTASVALNQTYDFGDRDWVFTSRAELVHQDAGWQVQWSPGIVHTSLSEQTRLAAERIPATRAPIVDSTGRAVVENVKVYKVGVDKSLVAPEQQGDSARALAKLVQVDGDGYLAAVAAAGEVAFVPAITLRQGQVPSGLEDIAGVRSVEGELPLTTTPYAASLLGKSSEATAEIIAASDGTIQAGDVVGVSGLQAIHDSHLRGQAGAVIRVVARDGTSATAMDLFSVAAVDAGPLVLTLDMDLQRRLEEQLAAHGNGMMFGVIVEHGSGAIRAMANSPAAGTQNFVATGAYPPGSTMKIVSALALIRRGLTADSPVSCTPTATFNGREFTNYPGYPAAFLGEIPLRTALAKSCNTAFMNAALSSEELASAAASLGIGVDYLTGFDAFYGQVPPTDDPAMLAASAIGQGEVVASPVGMAGEAASVAAGQTVVPWLIEGQQPQLAAAGLSEDEAGQLRIAMGDVISPGGTAPLMAEVLDGGKTGTAEIVVDGRQSNVLWLVGFNERYAICMMHYDATTTPIHDIARAILA